MTHKKNGVFAETSATCNQSRKAEQENDLSGCTYFPGCRSLGETDPLDLFFASPECPSSHIEKKEGEIDMHITSKLHCMESRRGTYAEWIRYSGTWMRRFDREAAIYLIGRATQQGASQELQRLRELVARAQDVGLIPRGELDLESLPDGYRLNANRDDAAFAAIGRLLDRI